MEKPRRSLYARHRLPAEVISLATWLYFRFPLSFRMVEEMLAARGIEVSHETVRRWAEKFGQEYANRIRRRTPRPGDRWHLDEMVISIAGKKALALAGCGPGSDRAGRLGPEPARPTGRQAPAAQAVEEERHGSVDYDYG